MLSRRFTGECRTPYSSALRVYRQSWIVTPQIVRFADTMPYRLVLFILQLGYIGHLFSSNLEHVNPACAVGSHFIFNNLLHFGWVMLFVRSLFGWAELLLIINFFNLSSLYFRHNAYPRFIHFPAVSGPLAWTFVAIYWNGAIMVHHPHSLVARVFANIFVWSILAYGGFFIVAYRVSWFDDFSRWGVLVTAH